MRRGPYTYPSGDQPHYLYRCFDIEGRLIYVGCTRNPPGRMATHRSAAWWFDQLATVRYTVFPSRAYAMVMERQAIAEERPRWNIQSRWPYRSLWDQGDYADYWTAIHNQAEGVTDHTRKHLVRVAAEAKRRYGIELEENVA